MFLYYFLIYWVLSGCIICGIAKHDFSSFMADFSRKQPYLSGLSEKTIMGLTFIVGFLVIPMLVYTRLNKIAHYLKHKLFFIKCAYYKRKFKIQIKGYTGNEIMRTTSPYGHISLNKAIAAFCLIIEQQKQKKDNYYIVIFDDLFIYYDDELSVMESLNYGGALAVKLNRKK